MPRADNKSGIPGISFNKVSKRWEVYIYINQKKINLKQHTPLERAVLVRWNAEKEFNVKGWENSEAQQWLKREGVI